MADMPLKVGYVLKRFPRLSETFVLNEILELERLGVHVEVFSLLRPPAEPRHALLSSLRARVTYLPRARVLNEWKLQRASELADGTGPAAVDLVTELAEPSASSLNTWFPGKEAAEAAHLLSQASTLGILALARGLDHFHAHFASNATTVALLGARLAGIPFSFTAHARDIYHTYVDPETDTRLRQRKLSEAAFVATVSEYNRAHLETVAGNCRADVRRLYNGIDLRRFSSPTDRAPDGPFLAVGRLVPKKGFVDLVRALGVLRRRAEEYACSIVGDGPERERLEAEASAEGVRHLIEFKGALAQEQLVQEMRRARAVVLPSVITPSGDRDGLPTVLLEALALGVPAVSTAIVGIPEIIEHRRTGLLVPPEDPAALADAMSCLARDPAFGAALGRAGRRKAVADFDLRSNVSTLAAWFSDAVSTRRRPGHAA